MTTNSLPPSVFPAEDSLSSGRRWETLDAGVCGGVWEGWRPAPAQQPTASSSSKHPPSFCTYLLRFVCKDQSASIIINRPQ